jgi:hypothetical protein
MLVRIGICFGVRIRAKEKISGWHTLGGIDGMGGGRCCLSPLFLIVISPKLGIRRWASLALWHFVVSRKASC